MLCGAAERGIQRGRGRERERERGGKEWVSERERN